MSSNNSENSENCCLDVVSPPPDPLMYPNHPSNSSNDLEKRTAPLVPSRPKYLQPKLNLRRSFGKQNDSSDLPPIPPKRIMIPISRSDNPHSPENSSDDEQQYLRSLSSSSLPPNRKPPPIPTSKPFDISHTDHSYVESLSESESGSIVSFTNHGVHSNNSSCADLDMLNDDDMHIRRTNIANEILNSELNYINTLRVLIDVWMKPILEQNPNEPIVPHESIKYLFSNVEIILNINQQFYNDFEKQMNQWSSTQCVGMVFLTLIPFFKVYMQYINNYNKSMEIYQDLLKKKVFKKYIEDCIRTGTQYDNLTSYLITPIQRIPRYQLLISELHKYTPQNHPDYKNIELALEKIKAMAEEINSHKRDAENLNQCAIIQNQLIFSDDMKKNHKKLVTPTRRYVSKGRFDVLINGIKCSYNYLVLFNDALLLTKKKKKGLLYFGFIYLNRISVEIDGNSILIRPHSFKNCVISIAILVEEKMNTWFEGLTHKIKEMSNQDDDELRLASLSDHGKKDSNDTEAIGKKKSFRKRILTIGKSKDKIKQNNENEKVPSSQDSVVSNNSQMNLNLNDELVKKLGNINTQNN